MSKYTFDWGGHYPLCMVEPSIERHKLVHEFLGESAKTDTFTISKEGITQSYTLAADNEKLDETSKQFLQEGFTDSLFFKSRKLRKQFYTLEKVLLKRPLDALSNKQLALYYVKTQELVRNLLFCYELTRPEYQNRIEQELSNLISGKDIDVNLLLETSEPDVMKQEQIAWEILLEQPFNERVLLEYAIRHHWVFPGSKDLLALLQAAKARYEKSRKAQHNTKRRTTKPDQETIFKQYPHIAKLSKLFQHIGLERWQLKKAWASAWNHLLRILYIVSLRTNLHYHVLKNKYTEQDVINLLNHGKILPDKILHDRRKYVMRYIHNNTQFLTGNQANSFIRDVEADQATIQVQGRSAFPGKATGKVVLIPNADIATVSKFSKEFNKGDILVTTMTQPSMVVLMKQAGAIIADEGGITSHAAIMAREFKIPCIVGAKVAMKQLKTGDMVEVDASRGTVRNLYKHPSFSSQNR